MTAQPADVALYTNDGVVISTNTATGNAIAALHPDARDTGSGELEMFFDSPADAQVLLDEKFSYLSRSDPIHEMIEVEDSIGFGSTIPITPTIPSVTVVDASRRINQVVRVRAYSHDTDKDRFALETLA